LKESEPCLLVSTQVVEAGVDLDFPLVLRAMGPLDRIVQAAGRCNREGLQSELGRVVVFDPAERARLPDEMYRSATSITAMMLRSGEIDPNDPQTYTRYFRRLYRSAELDAPQVQAARALLDYPEVSQRFRMIDDDGVPVLVKYRRNDDDRRAEDVIAAVRAARLHGMTRELRRRAQPFTVSVRRRQFEQFQRELLLEELTEDMWLWRPRYDLRRGMVREGYSPDDLIV
jgi:CRISPR-associated endonuclease/helicase Cas3